MTLSATSSVANTNLDLTTQGTGVVKANGVEVATISGTQTLTNKTLTNPKISSGSAILDSYGNKLLDFNVQVSNAVNYLRIWNRATTIGPIIEAAGTDTNINIQLNPKGSGSIYIWAYSGYTPTITANGADTNHNLNLVPKGTGVVQAGGVEVATISGTQTLTNKTLTTPKMSYITDTNGNTSMLLSASASAVNFLQVVNSATGNPIQIQPNGSDSNVGLSLRARGTGTVTVNTSGGANIAAFSQSTSPVNYFYFTPGGTGVNPQLAAVGTDTDISLNLVSKGTGNVQANGVDVVTISGTQTLTNKTLTAPKIDTIKDTNGATSIQLEAIASAVNFLKVTNSATGTAVSITSTGTDTNVSMSLRPKGTGTIVLRDGANLAVGQFIGVTSAVNRIDVTNAITSVAPSIAAAGSDTNIGLNLVSKGTGTVQANGVEVATISGTQTLTNKTITSAQITGTNEIQQNGTFSLYNTADQTTNYERARAYWSSDTFFLNTEKGGTGTLQALKLASGAAITLTLDGSGGSWKTRFVGSSSQALDLISMGLTSTASSGVPTAQKIDYTVNQSSTAGYTALSVAVTETATGSGTKLLIDTQVGGVSKFSVDNAGNLNTTGSILKDGLPVMTGVVVGSGQLQNNTYSIRRGGRTSWISGLHNDLAYLVERGGAVTCTLNAVDQGDKSNLFRGVTQFLTVGAVNDVYVFEITLPTVDMPYNDAYTLGFQQYGVFAQDITIEIYRGAAWTSVYEVTDTTDDVHWVVPNPSASTTKYRFTFTNFVNTNPFRLMEIFSVCHQAYGLSVKDSMTTLSRNGGNMYGTSSTPPTLTAAGSDTNISLNLVPKGTGVVKAGGVEVTTISGSQTLTNKTLTTPTLNTPTVNGFLLKDANANNLLSYVNSTVATSTSYLTLTTGVSGAGPQVTVTGAEANAGLVFWVKGTGLTQFRSTANSSKSIGLRVLPDANGVNWLDIANAANGSDPEIRAVSYSNEDTDVGINLTTTGTGVVQANGNPIISSITAIPAATGTPDSTTYLRGDGTWSTPSGGGGGMLAPVQGMTLGSETFTISSGSVTQISGTTINGYSPAIGDRILVANAPATTGTGSSYSMTNQPTNGIYEVTGNTTNLTVSRAADMSGSVKPGGLSVYVENADWPASKTLFFVETPNDLSAFTWGTTSISWKWSGGLSGQTQQVWITNNGLGLNIYNGTGWTYIGASNNAGNQDLTLPATTTDTIVARASTDTLTNKTISGASNTLSNIPQSAVTDLVGDLLSKVDLGPVANPLYVDAARVEPLPSIVCQAECTLGTGDMFMMLFRLTENVTVSNILSVATYGVSQTGATACRVGLYEVDEPFAWPYTMTCIARSASSAARWGTAGLDTAPIVDDGAASPGSISSVDLTAGQLYAVAFITVGHSGTAKLKSMGGHRPSSMTPVMAYYGGSHSDMPSSITATGWIEEWAFPWFALT